jgi:hypothetical protein
MAGNDNERTFVPAEIDALEDALEQAPMSALSLPSTLDDDARARIHDVLVRYRAIEHHARALLVVDPPASVLADVIAQARAAVAAPSAEPVALPPASAASTPSFWSRMKAMWIVPLATVGATALVLVMVTQKSDEAAPTSADAPARVAESRPAAAKADERPPLAQAEGRFQAVAPAEEEAQRGAGVDDVTSAAKPAEDKAKIESLQRDEKRRTKSAELPADPAPAVDPYGEPAPRPEPKSTPPASKKPAKPSSGGGGVPGGTPTTPSAGPKAPASTNTTDNAEKDATTDAQRLVRADAARERGDCDAARPDYDRVVETGTSKQRARARAGIALCLERQGDLSGARSLIDRARKDDAQIDAWVDANR